MPGLTDLIATGVLSAVVGKTTFPTITTSYVALFTTPPTTNSATTGSVEVSGGSYARQQTSTTTWNTPSSSVGTEPLTSPATTSNSATITFPTATANWGTVVAFGLFDNLATGNLLAWDYLGNNKWLPCTISSASPGVFTSPSHGYANGTSVVVTQKYGSGTLTNGTFSGLLTVAGAATDTFNVGVNTTATGDALVRALTQQAIGTGVQASFTGGAPGALVISSA
jgi:hypothetical protein